MTVRDKDAQRLLSAPFDESMPDELAQFCNAYELRVSVQGALKGDRDATTSYVGEYRMLAHELLSAVINADQSPSTQSGGGVLVLDRGTGQFEVVDKSGARGGWIEAALQESAAEAPFSRWTAMLGLERGLPVYVLAALRGLLPDAEPLEPPRQDTPVLQVSAPEAERFLRDVRNALNAGEPPLERVQRVLGLSATELGRLFGVTRQGVSDWMNRGVPAERQDKLATVSAIADLLEHKLKADRIPGIARRHADAYDGKTMLEFIAEDRQRELLELTRESFDWANAA